MFRVPSNNNVTALKRAPSKNDLHELASDLDKFHLDLTAAFQEVIKNVLSEDYEIKQLAALKTNEQVNPSGTLRIIILNKKDGTEFKDDQQLHLYRSIATLAEAIMLNFFIFHLNKIISPQLNLVELDIKQNRLRLHPDENFLHDIVIDNLNEFYDIATQTFSFAKFADYNVNLREEISNLTVKNPMPISSERIERACNIKNVVFAPYNTDPGFAIFISGLHKDIGGWTIGFRMECTEGHGLRYTLPAGVTGPYKFLFGRYDQGKIVPVSELHFEDGLDRQIGEQEASPAATRSYGTSPN